MICPQCRSADCLRSRRNGIIDFFASLSTLRPWRCHSCDLRFYARNVALPFARYAHCPKCGNFDLQMIARDRVESGTLVFLKRMLVFPAYRCDPCREKFFSVLPFRRILPSMLPDAERRVSRA
jgi:Zn ribbon nucleic-acid-binding protein